MQSKFGVQRAKLLLVNTYLSGHIASDWIIDQYYDRKLNISTSWVRHFSSSEQELTKFRDAGFVMSTPYSKLRKLRRHMNLTSSDALADIGCGSGRAVIYLARTTNVGRATGVDFDVGAVEAANRNRDRTGLPPDRVRFIREDATQTVLDDYNVIYMFNPFQTGTMAAFLENLAASLARKPRAIRIYYHNPTERSLYDRIPWLKATETLKWGIKPIIVYRNVA